MSKAFRLACFLWTAFFLLSFTAAAAAAPPRAIGGFGKQVHQDSDMGKDARGEFELVHLKWAGLTANEEIRRDHPQLSAALEKINQQEWQRMQKVRAEMKVDAANFRKESPKYYHAYVYDFDVQLRRADTSVVSFLQQEYTGGSGAHGMYSWQGMNLSTLTGEPIPLSAVVRDREKLAEAICQQLRQDYPYRGFGDLDENIRDLSYKDNLNWTLDPRGITFYFNPYEIASYAEGLLMATILFEEQPDLFQWNYRQQPGAYAQPFPADYNLMTSLRDNGKRDEIHVCSQDGAIHVDLNGREAEFLQAELTDPQPVLVHMGDGRNYLYIDGMGQDTSRKTLVVELGRKAVRYVNVLPYSFRHTEAVSPAVQVHWNFLTNPHGFYFDKAAPIISTSHTDICAVGEKGELTFG